MTLGYKIAEFLHLSYGQVRQEILERRRDIRDHRDAKGDNRCFLDDYLIWRHLSDSPPPPHFSPEEGMKQCENFWKYRRSRALRKIPKRAIRDVSHWDDDLHNPSFQDLLEKLRVLQWGIRAHRDVKVRTFHDDARLYRLLPENLPADFKLPPKAEFLGEAKAPNAGCPSFWRSHRGCDPQSCNLHEWGPCK